MYAWRLDSLDFALDSKIGAIALFAFAANAKYGTLNKLNGELQKHFIALLLPKEGKPMIDDKKKRSFKTASDRQLDSDLLLQKQSFVNESLANTSSEFGSRSLEFDFNDKGGDKGKPTVPPRRGSAYTDYTTYESTKAEDAPTHTALGSLLLSNEMMDLNLHAEPTEHEHDVDDHQRLLVESKLKINSLEAKVRQQAGLLKECKCSELRNQVTLLTMTNTTISSEKVVILERLTSIETLLAGSNNENARLKKQISELEASLATKDATLLAAGAAAEMSRADLTSSLQALQRENEALRDELAAMMKDNENLKAELATLKSTNDTFSLKLSDLSHELDSLEVEKSDKQQLAQQLQALKAASNDDASKLSALKYANDMLIGEVDKLNAELSAAKAKAVSDAAAADAATAKLANELSAVKAEQAADKEGLLRLDSDLQAELRRLNAELSTAKTQSSSAALAAVNDAAATAAVAAAAAAHEAKVAELKAELDSLRVAEADLKGQLLASQVAHQSAVAKHHAAAAVNFGTPLKKPPASDGGGLSPKDSSGRLTGGDLKFAEMEEELYEVRYKVIEHHNELLALIASIHLEASLEPLEPLDVGHLPKTRKPFTPTKHVAHDIDLSNGKVSELQVSITGNKAKLAAMLEMGEKLKSGASKLNLLEGSGSLSRRGSEMSVLDGSGLSSTGSSANLLSKRSSRHSMYELTNDPDYGLTTPVKSSPLNAADDARASQLLQHIQELSAIVDTDALIIERLRIVVDLVNNQLDSSAKSLKEAMGRILVLESSLHSTGSHVDERIAIINKMDAERATLEKAKNDEIAKLKWTIADLTGKLTAKTSELADLHAHIVEIESHVHQTHLEFQSVYSSVTTTTSISSKSFAHEADVGATNKKRLSLLTSTLEGYKTQLAAKISELSRLEAQLAVTRKQLSASELAKDTAVQESEKVNSLYVVLLEDLKKEQKKLSDTESRLVAIKQDHAAALSELNQQVSELLAAQKAAAAEKKTLSNECVEMKRQLSDLMAQTQQSEVAQGKKSSEQLSAAKKELTVVQAKLTEAQRLLDESKAHLKSKDDLLAVKEVSITTFENKLSDATAELTATKKELNELKRTVNELESNINKHNQEHDFDELLAQAAQATSDSTGSGAQGHHVRGSMNITRIVTSSVHSSTIKRESHTTHGSGGVAETSRVEVRSSSDSVNQMASKVHVTADGEAATVSEVYSTSNSHKESMSAGKEVRTSKMITEGSATVESSPGTAVEPAGKAEVESEKATGSNKTGKKNGRKNNSNKNKK